jgi:hypothetical protein
MTDLKPKIFIGSSKAGYSVAEKVKAYLSDLGDCFLWKEPGIWEPNRSTFDNLLRKASYSGPTFLYHPLRLSEWLLT